jgi:hypothetical protein
MVPVWYDDAAALLGHVCDEAHPTKDDDFVSFRADLSKLYGLGKVGHAVALVPAGRAVEQRAALESQISHCGRKDIQGPRCTVSLTSSI